MIQLNKDNIRIVADVFNIHEPGVHEVSYTVSYPGNIPNGNVEILSRSPGTIQVVVEEKVTKKLDLTVKYKGAVPNGYLTDEANVQLDTDTVSVSGPKSLMDRVVSAKTVVDIEGRTETFTAYCSVTLYDADGNVVEGAGISSDSNSVRVTLQIKQLKEVDVVFKDIIYGGGATKDNTKITQNITKLKIAGHKNLLSNITKIEIGVLDLSQVIGNSIDYLRKQVALVNPKIIVCLGRIAAKRILYPDYKITMEHGSWINRNGIWMTAIYHPSALLRDVNKRPETFEDLLDIRKKLQSVK